MSRSGGFLASVSALSAARAAAVASQVLIIPILARSLTPADFGIVALAMSVAALTHIFSDAGMARSLIRTPLDAVEEWSSVFWFLGAVGGVLSGVILALVPAAVWFFEEPALYAPLIALSPTPLMLSLGAAFTAEMERRGAFAELALSQVSATLLSFLVAVWMALAGFGFWALIVQQIILIGARSLWAAVRSRFRPSVSFSMRALGPHFRFGRDITVSSLLSYAGEQSTTLVIGKAFGAAELGLYSMTQRFARLPLFGLAGPFGQVLYVRLAGVSEDLPVFRRVVVAAVRLLGLAILPGMAAVAVAGEEAFVLVLSEKWAEVAPIFALIAGGAALRAVTNPTFVALAALGRTDQRLLLTIEITGFWLILLLGSGAFGVAGIALAYTAWMLLQLPLHWRRLERTCGLGALAFLRALTLGVIVAVLVAVAMVLAFTFSNLEGWARLGLGAGVAMLTFGAAAVAVRDWLKDDLASLRG